MHASTFELFRIGIGPSSSHTMGPMVAAEAFVRLLPPGVARVCVDLFGSLALTGKGHATDRAVLLGLSGRTPAELDPNEAAALVARIRDSGRLQLGGVHDIAFNEETDVRFNQRERRPFHSNAMSYTAYDAQGAVIACRTYYSIGGGAIVSDEELARNEIPPPGPTLPYPFDSAADLLRLAGESGLTIAAMIRANEGRLQSPEAVNERLHEIAQAMTDCIIRGMTSTEAELPGGLRVRRRAPAIRARLLDRQERALSDPLTTIDWINLWAMAVNEENAGGGKVVTAPTNGAAGVIPAVLRYYQRFVSHSCPQGVEEFLLTAAAIGSLFKQNASISGAEVGCQGEVGVACSMAAAGLSAALGATPEQIENAAEIGMEHNLGLTCDPIAGLVQVPCIERNAVAAVKAVEASRIAMLGDGTHRVSLDQVIETMHKTGLDMSDRYKETSMGGLAVNVVEC